MESPFQHAIAALEADREVVETNADLPGDRGTRALEREEIPDYGRAIELLKTTTWNDLKKR